MKALAIAGSSLLAGLLMLQPTLLPAQEKTTLAPLSLSLRDAVRMALAPQGSLAIGIAGESERVAEAQLREAKASALPQIGTSLTGQNQVLNLSALGFNSIHLPIPGYSFPRSLGPFDTVDARVHVRQTVFDMASVRRSNAGRAGIATAKAETDEVRDQIAAQVAKLYLVAVHASGAVDVAKARVEPAETSLREVTNRTAEGKALAIDVSHARVRVASEKQLLMQAQLEQGRASLDLLNALNRDLDTPLSFTEPLTFTPQDTWTLTQALAIAVKSRSEIATEKKRADALRLTDVSIQSERLPSVAAYADMGSLGTTVANSIGTYDVGVSLNIPVFDGGRRDSRRAETQASIRQEELRVTQLEKQVELEIRQALLKLDMARGQVEISASEVDIAQEELSHRRRRYEQGIEGQMEVAEAQLTLAGASETRLAALYTWNEARIELMQAMGTIRNLAQ